MTVRRPTPDRRRSARPTTGDAVRVALGGAAGSVARWAVVVGVDSTATFPWPTLVVNLIGCFVVGLLINSSRSTVMLVGIGFAGGLTTFSSFAVEIADLLDRSDLVTAAAYTAMSVAGGAAAVILGRRTAPLPGFGRCYGTSGW